LSKHGVVQAEVWQTLKQELWPGEHPRLHRFIRCGLDIVRALKAKLGLLVRRLLLSPFRAGSSKKT
jgi:hypothetical protein